MSTLNVFVPKAIVIKVAEFSTVEDDELEIEVAEIGGHSRTGKNNILRFGEPRFDNTRKYHVPLSGMHSNHHKKAAANG